MSNNNYPKTDNFGTRLQIYRQEKGLTGKQFSEIIGISQGSLSELENGKRDPSGKVFQGIVENTDIDICWLITGKKTNKFNNSPCKCRKFEILDEAEEWLTEQVEKDPERESWFKVEFKKAFPEWKKWKEEKEESEAQEDYPPSRKVA